jgi:phosphoribosylaminoimidazole-succinocarboxamide synthase
MLNGIPGKGKILTQLSLWWFEQIEKDLGVRTHIITGDVHKMPSAVKKHADILEGRCMLVKHLDMLPVEAIVRGYITGSGFKEYKKQGTVCSIPLPKGLRDCEVLEAPIFTPSTKAEFGTHDENISYAKCVEVIGAELSEQMSSASKSIYEYGSMKAQLVGLMLADTKMEWGLDENNQLVLADEVLTPDCSRFWEADKYEVGRQQDSLDKQFVRNYLLSINFDKETPVTIPGDIIEKTLEKYKHSYRIFTGKEPQL